jgi:hypothetical protein
MKSAAVWSAGHRSPIFQRMLLSADLCSPERKPAFLISCLVRADKMPEALQLNLVQLRHDHLSFLFTLLSYENARLFQGKLK